MIGDGDAEQRARLLEDAREAMVLGARRRVAARMVVHEDDVRRSAADRRLEHLTRMHERIRECADGHVRGHQHLVLRTQRQDEKVFALLRSEARAQQLCHILRLADTRAALRRTLCTPSKFERGEHGCRLCHADARDARKLRTGHREDLGKPRFTKPRHNPVRKFQYILAPPPRPQENGKQLRIAERLCAAFDQSLARQLTHRQITQIHRRPPS